MEDPDARPKRMMIGNGNIVGPRAAVVKRSPPGEAGRWCVWRTRETGAMDWVTFHYRRRAADRAAKLYEKTGKVKGFKA